jgi:TET-Associated Glycosyltransferase
MLNYKIVIPSRRRVQNMPPMRALLPDAFVCVDEAEVADYRAAVPESKIIPHPPLGSLARIRNWILNSLSEPVIVMIDDDLLRVRTVFTRTKKSIRDPESILDIIENSMAAAQDCGAGVFCWMMIDNPYLLSIPPDFAPIKMNGVISGSFGLLGRARETRRFDERMIGKADFDFTLETLRVDRFMFVDTRFQFHHARVFGGQGGNVGLIDQAAAERTNRRMRKKWGGYFSDAKPNYVKKGAEKSEGFRLMVRRGNPRAAR